MLRSSIYLLFTVLIFAGCKPENTSPCILQATYSRSSLVFRADSTYEWSNGSGLGFSTNEGTYSMHGNRITIDKVDDMGVLKTRELLITSTLPWDSTSGSFVIQVDKMGRAVDRWAVFVVYIDNRAMSH